MRVVRPYMRMMAPAASEGIFEISSTGEMFRPFDPGHGIELIRRVEWCARISHRSEDKVTEDSWRRFLQDVIIKHGDWSVVEHCLVNVDALVDRGITHEIVRHRLASYTQESTRFVRYFKEKEGDVINPAQFIYPQVDVECARCLGNGAEVHDGCPYLSTWISAILNAESFYKELLQKGWRPQEARSVFPNALASRIVITMNLRTWRHFFVMRTSAQAHPQMRQVTIPLLEEFKKNIPLIYDDIVPNGQQSEMMKLVR